MNETESTGISGTGRDLAGRFAPGVSGNPRGRKPMSDELKRAFEDLLPRSVEVLATLMGTREKPPKDLRLAHAAAETVQNRVLGRPVETTKILGDSDAPVLVPSVTSVQIGAVIALWADHLGLSQGVREALSRAVLFGELPASVEGDIQVPTQEAMHEHQASRGDTGMLLTDRKRQEGA